MASFTLKTVFAAVDSMTKPIKAMTKSVDELGRSSSKAKGTIAAIGKGFSIAGKSILAVGSVAVAAGTAAAALAVKTSEAADSIRDTSSALGISAKALQEYRYLAKLSGMETADMDAALQKLTINLGKGGGDVEAALSWIGLSTEKLKTAGPDRVLETVADAMAKVTDPAKKAAVTTALFGKSSVRMVNAMAEGSEGIRKLREEANSAGYVMDDLAISAGANLGDSLDRLKATFEGLTNRVGLTFIPVMDRAVQGLTNFLAASGGNITGALSGLGELLESTFGTIQPIIEGAFGLIKPLLGLLTKTMKALAPLFSRLAKIVERLIPVIADLAEFIGVVLVEALNFLMPILEPVFDILEVVLMALSPVIKLLTWSIKKVIELFKALPGPVKTALEVLFAVLVPFYGIPLMIAKHWEPIKAFFVGVWAKIKEPIGGAFDAILDLPGKIIDGLKTVPDKLSAAFNFLLDLPGKIIEGFLSIPGAIMGFLEPILGPIESLLDRLGFKGKDPAMAGGPSYSAAGIGPSTSTGIPSSVPISSQSTVIQRGIVDVNFAGAPAGTSVKASGAAAPRVSLSTGSALDVRGR